MGVTEITSFDQFQQIINKDTYTVFDFWAAWCGPCRMISPIFERLSEAEEISSKVEFYKVDVDAQEQISQEVGIRAMPTFVLFKNGCKVNDLCGANPQALEEMIRTAINN